MSGRVFKRSVLLLNPCIHDFAAYDFWFKPLGLLSIGGLLRRFGYRVNLVDCLDRHHPELLSYLNRQTADERPDGTGKFVRQEIAKPPALAHVPRTYCRYGMPPQVVAKLLDNIEPPDVVLITSFMTYWYPAVAQAARMIRRRFPKAVIILGGIYATLAPEHARATVKPDYLIVGEGEKKAVRLIAKLTGGPGKDFDYSTLDELPWPALDLYPNLRSAAIITSRGCPFRCSFCASKIVAPNYRRRSAQNVVREIACRHEQYGVNQFAFFDDALLLRADDFAKPIFRGVIKNDWPIHFHTPNGLTPRYVDQELAELFYAAGVQTVRLSFESSNPQRQKAMSAKVSNVELERAMSSLCRAGYENAAIGVYVMMGLPDQAEEEVLDSINYVHSLGARVNLASFSPIPGTEEWRKAIAKGTWNKNDDMLLTNTSLFPIWSKTIGAGRAQRIANYAKSLNEKLPRQPNKKSALFSQAPGVASNQKKTE